MIFKPRLAHLIVAGKKTMTRRPVKPGQERCRYVVGKSYAIQPGRGKAEIARLVVTDVFEEALGAITFDEARAEGFRTRDEFLAYWAELHGAVDLEQRVWAITFHLAREHRPKLLAASPGQLKSDYTDNSHHALRDEPEVMDADGYVAGNRVRHRALKAADGPRSLEERWAKVKARAEAAGLDIRWQERSLEKRIAALEAKLNRKDAA